MISSANGELMASMRNGCGDLWSSVFCEAGVALIGLSHESSTFEPNVPKPWVFAGLPSAFEENVRREPAFDADNSTKSSSPSKMWRRSTTMGL